MTRTLAVISLLALSAAAARAADDVAVAEARKLFVDGTDLVRRAQWSEALAAFEQSARLRPHAITTYNIGACERALGRYTRARATFARSLDENGRVGQLPPSLSEEARAFVAEIDGLLAHADVSVDPPEAAVIVDGRPLAIVPPDATRAPGARPIAVAGTLAPGLGAPAPAPRFELLLDPGAHVFTLSHKGFGDVVVNRGFAPGAHTRLELALARLPATLHIDANRAGAVVAVDGVDVGAVPVDVERPAGSYTVAVRKPGFGTYQTHLVVRAGERADLNAPLAVQKTPIYRKWWFWTAAAVVVVGASVGGYFAARAAETPTLDGGGLAWAVKLR
jgi:PEGA domain